MEQIRDVIYEAWFFRLSGSISVKEKNGKKLFKSKGSWREKYFILVRLGDELFLEWYDKKPADANVQPKDRLSLWPSYRLTKCHAERYVCSVFTPTQQVHVGATDQSSIDTFAFNLQTQTVLRDSLEGTSFAVLPENTLDQDRLGAVGSVCVLHVSPWGISLALQQSRSLIAHWPLKCVRSYESDSRGHFSLDSGTRSPFGEGTYVFQTRRGQDDQLYNMLENYVMQAASLADNYPGEPTDEDEIEYDHLKRLTIVHPRPRDSVRASMYASGFPYDNILLAIGEFSGDRDSVVTSVPDIVSDSAHADHKNRQSDAGGDHTHDISSPRDSSNLMNFGDYPQLVSPTESRQVMIKPRTLIDKSIVVSQELPKPLSLADDLNQYEEPDDDLIAKKEKQKRGRPLPPSIPPPGPFSKPPPPKRSDSRNQIDYEEPKVEPVEYDDLGIPRGPPPPVPKAMADIPHMPPPPIPMGIDIPRVPPPPVPTEPMTTFTSRSHAPLVRENTYVDVSEMNPYNDPDMPLDIPLEPPPPVPRRPPPVPPFPPTLAVDDNLNEYAEMSASVPSVINSSLSNNSLNQQSRFEDPYADAQDLDAVRRLATNSRPNDCDEYLGMDSLGARPPVPSINNNSVEYFGPNDTGEYLGMDSLGNSVSQIQLRRSPDPTMMDTSDSGAGDEYLKMSDVRKSAPVTVSGGQMSLSGYSKSMSMYEMDQSPHVVDIDIDGPELPEVWVTPVKGYKGKDINRNTIGSDQFKTWSHGSRLPDPKPDDDDDIGYLLLPPKLSRTRLQSQSCEELSERVRQSQVQEPNEEGYFEINDDGIVVNNVPMPFTGLLDMKHLKKGGNSPPGIQENVQGKGGLSVPTIPRFQRSVSNPDVAGKGRKAPHGKRESEESPQKRQSKFSAFLYGTLHKKKSKSKISTDGDASPGTTPRSKPMKAISPQDKLLKPDYKSPKDKSDKHDKHKQRKLSGPAGSHKDIIGGIEITPKAGKSFIKVKKPAGESSPRRGTSYPNQPTIRTPSPNMGGRRLPSLPSEFDDRDRLNTPRANIKHAQSQPNLI